MMVKEKAPGVRNRAPKPIGSVRMKDVNMTVPVMTESVNGFFQESNKVTPFPAEEVVECVEMQLLRALQQRADAFNKMMALIG